MIYHNKKTIIGFIGQGFIGKNYADDFERHGYEIVRYSLEAPYVANKETIRTCDMVFVAVPTPTTPEGFDDSALRAVLPLVGKGKIAVIKSTTLPGTTKLLQKSFPDIFILQSPEFLTEKNAAEDAAHPQRTIIGIPEESAVYKQKAQEVLAVLPKAQYELVADSTETELTKYAGNTFLYFKVLYANLFYDLAEKLGVRYDTVREALSADPRIGPSHLRPVDTSGHPGAAPGRGAGGHCLIKDFAALRILYETLLPGDTTGSDLLHALESKNATLLVESGKDIDLLQGVYGKKQ